MFVWDQNYSSGSRRERTKHTKMEWHRRPFASQTCSSGIEIENKAIKKRIVNLRAIWGESEEEEGEMGRWGKERKVQIKPEEEESHR